MNANTMYSQTNCVKLWLNHYSGETNIKCENDDLVCVYDNKLSDLFENLGQASLLGTLELQNLEIIQTNRLTAVNLSADIMFNKT